MCLASLGPGLPKSSLRYGIDRHAGSQRNKSRALRERRSTELRRLESKTPHQLQALGRLQTDVLEESRIRPRFPIRNLS
jgi:hypothetical protein